MATIKDVARDAGVSVGTVSNVINGVKVRDEKRIQVENSIKKLNYHVNGWGRAQNAQKTDCVLVMLPGLDNPYFSMLLGSLEKELCAQGKQVILCLSDEDRDKEKKFIELADKNKVDGIIGITYSNIEEYLGDSVNFVSIDRHFSSEIPVVACDNEKGGWMAAEVLHKRGSRELLCMMTISSLGNEVEKRRRGFEEYCKNHDVTFSSVQFSENQVNSIYSSFECRDLIRRVLNMGSDSIDGIFAGTDHLAIVICEELRKMGKRVPEDVQVIGFDGIRLLNHGEPLVSSIEQPVRLIAESAVDSLMRLLRNEEVADNTTLPVCFVDGGTTRKLETDNQETEE